MTITTHSAEAFRLAYRAQTTRCFFQQAYLNLSLLALGAAVAEKQSERGCMKRNMRGASSWGSAAARKLRMALRADPGAPFPPSRPLLLLILGHKILTRTPMSPARERRPPQASSKQHLMVTKPRLHLDYAFLRKSCRVLSQKSRQR